MYLLILSMPIELDPFGKNVSDHPPPFVALHETQSF